MDQDEFELQTLLKPKYDSFDDARIDRHKMEIKNPDVIIDIIICKE